MAPFVVGTIVATSQTLHKLSNQEFMGWTPELRFWWLICFFVWVGFYFSWPALCCCHGSCKSNSQFRYEIGHKVETCTHMQHSESQIRIRWFILWISIQAIILEETGRPDHILHCTVCKLNLTRTGIQWSCGRRSSGNDWRTTWDLSAMTLFKKLPTFAGGTSANISSHVFFGELWFGGTNAKCSNKNSKGGNLHLDLLYKCVKRVPFSTHQEQKNLQYQFWQKLYIFGRSRYRNNKKHCSLFSFPQLFLDVPGS